MMNTATVKQVCLLFFLGFSLGKDSFTSIQYPLLWPPQVCDGSKQPAYYHVLCL